MIKQSLPKDETNLFAKATDDSMKTLDEFMQEITLMTGTDQADKENNNGWILGTSI